MECTLVTEAATILKVCVLASSSSGNCTFVATDRTRLLIDAGISRRETAKRLAAIGESIDRIDAVLITHEHSDHVCGLPAIAKREKVPVYLTHQTAPCIEWQNGAPPLECFQAGTSFTIGDIEVDSFTIPHDAADPVGYCFRSQGLKLGVVTDLGYIPESVRFHLRDVHWLLLECNHDLEMLKVGPYPWSVKQRVMGRKGHLSNEVVEQFLRDDLAGTATHVVLGHLSEHNNHPEVVRVMADGALAKRALFTRAFVASPGVQTEAWAF